MSTQDWIGSCATRDALSHRPALRYQAGWRYDALTTDQAIEPENQRATSGNAISCDGKRAVSGSVDSTHSC